MPFLRLCLYLVIGSLFVLPVFSQGVPAELGGDRFVTGAAIDDTGAAGRDLLAMGASVSVSGSVAQDINAMGFDVDIDAVVGGDIVAAGASVSVRGPASGDLTASGVSVRTGPEARISGNARLAGASVVVNGAVDGALRVAGADITLNAPVAGDVILTGADITFGPEARIDGTLHYSAEAQVDIPDRVISSDRVQFTAASDLEMWGEFRADWQDWDGPLELTAGRVVIGFLINLALFLLIGAIFLSLAPNVVRSLRRDADRRPDMVILTGAIGLSILFGVVPVSILSIVGLLLLPILLLLILAAWTLGYILGAYIVAMRVMRAFGGAESPPMFLRLLALAIGVTVAALLNYIPIFGWLVNFALVLLGVGAITTGLFYRMFDRFGAERDQGLEPLPPGSSGRGEEAT